MDQAEEKPGEKPGQKGWGKMRPAPQRPRQSTSSSSLPSTGKSRRGRENWEDGSGFSIGILTRTARLSPRRRIKSISILKR